MKMPRPSQSTIHFDYFGYIIAPSLEEAIEIFNKPENQMKEFSGFKKQTSLVEHHNPTLLHHDRKSNIASSDVEGVMAPLQFGEAEDGDEDMIPVENIDGDWVNMC
mmetsp:Transcript_18827/g.13643  ORF Transcript_18827/g.13643 Transcript_18827/m.13643 type:complete len:106 (+) Transcript_18827:419-736(+)